MISRRQLVLVLAMSPSCGPPMKTGTGWSRSSVLGEIGFVFNPDYHGRGLATEAAESMLMLGFDTIRWHRIIGSCDARNHPSARLMERIGMRQEARFVHNQIVKGQWADELVYAILDHEWRAGKPPAGLGFAG
jgi:RimJ/RimL family protein N-acetyltransferase